MSSIALKIRFVLLASVVVAGSAFATASPVIVNHQSNVSAISPLISSPIPHVTGSPVIVNPIPHFIAGSPVIVNPIPHLLTTVA